MADHHHPSKRKRLADAPASQNFLQARYTQARLDDISAEVIRLQHQLNDILDELEDIETDVLRRNPRPRLATLSSELQRGIVPETQSKDNAERNDDSAFAAELRNGQMEYIATVDS
ncbi:hypothetical protein AMS68_002751 [Peltaster fructicola]|uniref:Uncharacterized protein n=1 Tax=Peltaster fructicola TaxID=286661 RepID=A0A6H0XR72_9PEZI|nr:hypothetical protein AMS68_002751 [Peltaster fructicola]